MPEEDVPNFGVPFLAMRLLSLLLPLFCPTLLLAQAACQPMVGHVGMRDVRILTQMDRAGELEVSLWSASTTSTGHSEALPWSAQYGLHAHV